MTTQQDLTYRQLVTLPDGARVLLRPMVADDKPAFLALYSNMSAEDQRAMRHNLSDPQLVDAWVEQLDYERELPLVGMAGDRMAGHATLHLNPGPARHRADVMIYLARDFRGRGLGTRMLQAVIDLAKRRSLYLLAAQVVSERTSDIRAFQKLGFETKCTYEDWFMLPDGEFMDAVHLILRLRSGMHEF